MKIKKILNDLINVNKEKLKEFFFTTISICLLTVVIVINYSDNIIDLNIYSKIVSFLCTFISGAFFIETKYKNKKEDKKKKKIYFIFNLLLSSLFVVSNIIFDKGLVYFYTSNIQFAYLFSIVIYTVYLTFVKSKKNLNEYLCILFNNVFKRSIVFGVVALGVLFILLIFNYLIMGFDYFIEVELLIFGCFYLPSIVYSFSDTKEEISLFVKNLIKYVLDILVLIAVVIIYIYILKIIVINNMPENLIFKILTALFVVEMPVCLMVKNYNENKFLDKINNKLPLLFIPFIILQMYSLIVRIYYYGLTATRYVGIIVIIFEIIFILMYLFKEKKLCNILITMIILINISLICPILNMYTMSNISHYKILKTYKEKENLTESEKVKIYNSYEYLLYAENGKIFINHILNENDKKTVQSFYNDFGEDNVNLLSYGMANKVDVSLYNEMYNVEYSEADIKLNDLKNITFNSSNESMKFDLYNTIINYINNKDTFDNYIKSNNEIIINNNIKLIINDFDMYYKTDKVDSIYIRGYLLVKDN